MDIREYVQHCQGRVDHFLDQELPLPTREPQMLHKAMRYSVLNGGKRIRASLLYAVGEALGTPDNVLDRGSAAIELIHAFSLVHDDLPAIDNDDLRRGKPACHKAFGEATAILAGDALLTLAFELLTSFNVKQINPANNLKMVNLLSHYIGSLGMAGGEALDVEVTDHEVSLGQLAYIYKLKTSYLLCASILLGALSANCKQEKILINLEKFGIYIGLAFQIHDDIIGIETDTEILGKPQGSDLKNHKPTYPQLLGIDKAKVKQQEYFDQAIQFLKKTKLPLDILIALSEFVIERKY